MPLDAKTRKEIARLRSGGGSKGGSVSKSEIARLREASKGVGYVGQAEKPSLLGSIGGALKDAGSATLKSLSVPFAAGSVLAIKTAHAINSDVEDTSWKAAGGDFTEEGKRASREFARRMGLPNSEWAGLGLAVALDPLNLVGVGAATKIAKAGKVVDALADGQKAIGAGKTARAALEPTKIRGALGSGVKVTEKAKDAEKAAYRVLGSGKKARGRLAPVAGPIGKGRQGRWEKRADAHFKVLQAKRGTKGERVINLGPETFTKIMGKPLSRVDIPLREGVYEVPKVKYLGTKTKRMGQAGAKGPDIPQARKLVMEGAGKYRTYDGAHTVTKTKKGWEVRRTDNLNMKPRMFPSKKAAEQHLRETGEMTGAEWVRPRIGKNNPNTDLGGVTTIHQIRGGRRFSVKGRVIGDYAVVPLTRSKKTGGKFVVRRLIDGKIMPGSPIMAKTGSESEAVYQARLLAAGGKQPSGLIRMNPASTVGPVRGPRPLPERIVYEGEVVDDPIISGGLRRAAREGDGDPFIEGSVAGGGRGGSGGLPPMYEGGGGFRRGPRRNPHTGHRNDDPTSFMDEYGNTKNWGDHAEGAMNTLVSEKAADKYLQFRFGIGKLKKTYTTGIRVKKGGIASKTNKPGRVLMSGAEQILRRRTDQTEDLTQNIQYVIENLTKKHDLTAADRTLLTVFLETQAESRELGQMMRARMIDDGVWDSRLDEVADYITSKYKDFAVGEGMKTYAVQYDELAKAEKELLKQYDEALGRGVDETTKKMVRLRKKIEQTQERLAYLERRGDYSAMNLRGSQHQAIKESMKAKVKSGEVETPLYFKRHKPEVGDPGQSRVVDNAFAGITAEQFMKDMAAAGVDENVAKNLRDFVSKEFEEAGVAGFRETPINLTHAPDFEYLPEWDALQNFSARQQGHYVKILARDTERLMAEAGIAPESALGRSLTTGFTTNRAPGSITSLGRPARILQAGTTRLKLWYTVMSPAHYFTNAVGDYLNSLITGNIRHAGTTAALGKGSRYWKLATMDPKILDETFEFAGQKYTGRELALLARMSGLGKGFADRDILTMMDLQEGGFMKGVMKIHRNRDEAMRMSTWFKHMQAGDDPMTAASKTIRSHLDYGALTNFERVWLRHLVLFYTWMKKNAGLQMYGLATRPGLYAARMQAGKTREEYPGEPDYYKKMMALGIPGLGNVSFADPATDIYKLTLNGDELRKNTLGSLNPLIKIPSELLTNRNFLTGGEIQSYAGQQKPSALAAAMSKIGLLPDGYQSSSKAGGEVVPALPAFMQHVVDSLGGPIGANAQAVTKPESAQTPLATALRIGGIRIQENNPAAFARQQERKRAREKADKTRAYNAQRG